MSQVLYDQPFSKRSNLINFIPSKNRYKQVYYNRRRDQCWLFKKPPSDKEDLKDNVKKFTEKAPAPAGEKDIDGK